MKSTYESIELDEDRGGIVVTSQKFIEMQDKDGTENVKKKLRAELENIVRQVKGLKIRAEEIKILLGKLEEKAESIDSALPESQLSPVE